MAFRVNAARNERSNYVLSRAASSLLGESSVTPYQFLVASAIMLSFTTLFVLARLFASFRRGQGFWIDGIATLSILSLSGLVGLDYYLDAKLFTDPSLPLTKMLNFSIAVDWLAALAMWCSKAPILCLYISLFGVRRWLRITSYVTLVVFAAAIIIAAAIASAPCDPNHQEPDLLMLFHCTEVNSKVGVGLGILSVTADVIIMILPIPVILTLNLPTAKKLGLLIMFMSGIFAVAASATAVYYKWQLAKGSTAYITLVMLCVITEGCIATAVGCMPAIYTIWTQVLRETSLYGRLSHISFIFSSASIFSARPKTGTNRSGQSLELPKRSGSDSGSSDTTSSNCHV